MPSTTCSKLGGLEKRIILSQLELVLETVPVLYRFQSVQKARQLKELKSRHVRVSGSAVRSPQAVASEVSTMAGEVTRMSAINSPGTDLRGKQQAVMKAQWDDSNTRVFVNLCIDEILVGGNKPGQHLNRKGWENIIVGFKNLTGVQYTKAQLKNRWDRLRQEWGWWKDLLRNETGLGRNVETGAIDASDDWWKLKLERYPNAVKFRYKPLPMEEELDILFNDKAATGEWQYTTSTGIPPTDDDVNNCYKPVMVDEDTTDETEKVVIVDPKELSKKRLSSSSSQGSRKLNGAARLSRSLDKIVAAVSSTGASPKKEICEPKPTTNDCMEFVRTIPALLDNKEAMVWCVKVFKDHGARINFMNLADEDERLIWLNLEIQIEKAKFDKQTAK